MLKHLTALWPTNGHTGLAISPRAAANSERILSTREQITEALVAASEAGSGPHAMQVAAVYACIRLLSEAIASLPFGLYDHTPERDELDTDHPITALIADEPNPWQTPYDFMRYMATCLLMRGNFYAQIVRRGDAIDALVPLAPDRVEPRMVNGVVSYTYRVDDNTLREMPQRDVLHIRALSTDGLKGLGPLQAAKRAIQHNVHMSTWNSSLFGNGVRPSGVLKHPGQLTDEAVSRLKQSFEESYSGTENTGRPMVLEEGMSWDTLSLTAEDLQFIEGMKFTRAEIAMFFAVPPHMIGDIERGTSWGSGLEQQNLGFLIYTLKPWLVNIAQAMRRYLLEKPERRNYVFKFDTSDLTRADFAARQAGLEKQLNAGVISVNEWRRVESLNPIDGGDTYRSAGNVRTNSTATS